MSCSINTLHYCKFSIELIPALPVVEKSDLLHIKNEP